MLPLLRGETESIRTHACSQLKIGDSCEWALRTPHWALLLPISASSAGLPAAELYVKPDDRWEVNNVRQHHLELAERLEQTLRSFVEATRRPGPLLPPQLRDLESTPETHSTEKGIPS